jgi:hypothetical protein
MIKKINSKGFQMINRIKKEKSIFYLMVIGLFLVSSLLFGRDDDLPMLAFQEDVEFPKISLKDEREIPAVVLEDESQIPPVSLKDESELPVLSLEGNKKVNVDDKKESTKEVKPIIKRLVPVSKKSTSSLQLPRASFVKKEKPLVLKKEVPVRSKVVIEKEDEVIADLSKSKLSVKSDSMLDLTKTEAGSLKIKKEKFDRKEKKESPLVLSAAWKEMMEEDFYKKTKYMSEIVNQGEEDQQEKEDFIDRFKKNKEWISASLAATTTVADPYFDALMQRKERIDLLVKAQKQADLLIHKMTLVKKVSEVVQSKLRLAVLYALNDLISSTNQVPSLRKIQALVEEKALLYGSLKDKEYKEAESPNILNAELMHEIKKLKKRLTAENKKHEQEYAAIKKELEAKERLAEEIRIKNEQVMQDLDVKNVALKVQEEKIKDAELKTSLMQQVQKEIEFDARRDMEATNKRSLQLEISLAEAEKERFAAEKSLIKALADYKEVKELVSLLQKQAEELSTDNQTLLLNLERTVHEKSTLALEKQHAQKQLDRFTKEIAQLKERLVDQKKQMDRLQVTLEKAGNEKKYVLSQVTTMKAMQQRQKETERKLEERVALLNKRLDDSSKKNLELSQLIAALKEEYRLTLEQIKSIESLRNESLENSGLLRKEISRLLKEQTRQKVRSEELSALLEKGQMPRKEKKGLKKELTLLKQSQEQIGIELGVIQDLYETEQLQQDNLSTILQEMKVQIFDQEGQLEELEKRSVEKAEKMMPAKTELIEDEGKITELKRKNRALKNKIKELERVMKSKNASKEEEYFAKDHTKTAPVKEVEEVEIEEVLKKEDSKKEEPEKKKVPTLSKKEPRKSVEKENDVVINENHAKEKTLEKTIEKEEKAAVKKEVPKKPARPMEEIVGSFSQAKKESSTEVKPIKPAVQQRKAVSPAPATSSVTTPAAPAQAESSSSGSSLPDFNNEVDKELNAQGEEEKPVEMQDLVNAIQKGIQEDPEAFKQTILQAAENITEDDVLEAQKHIEAMSPEEREEFTSFIGNMIEAMPPELLSGEMFTPKK